MSRLRSYRPLLMTIALMAATGCAASAAGAGPSAAAAASAPPPRARPADTSPQNAAAEALIAQARNLLKAGKNEAALGRLERAASLSPRNGEGQYWLAEVWLAKGDRRQAAEHHRLAARYLAGREDWAGRLKTQNSKVR